MKPKKMLSKGKEKESSYDILLSILPASGDDMFDEQNLEMFLEFMDSSSCLSNPATGSCVMREANDLLDGKLDLSKSSLCFCPLWLKDIMRAFYFINVYSACLQLWQRKITISALEGPLDQLHKFGFRPGIADLEILSQFCPEVIYIVNNEIDAKTLRDALVITKSTEEKNDKNNQLFTGGKRLPRSKIINSMKKRETSFTAILSKAVKSLMFKYGAEVVKSFSSEDLLVFVKKADAMGAETEVKQERKRCSAASSSHSYEVQCHDTKSLLPEEMVRHLKSGIGSQGQVVHIEEISARNAKYVEIPCQLSENVKSALNHVGITRLYSHQAESIQASLAGKNVIVATMTSSGKSLCYNIPVLEVLSQNPLACALYLFPTKALAQDQMRALSALAHGLDDSLNIGIYDGDTSQGDRLWLRDNARVLITNPDMLHVSILPFHGQFRRILSNLSIFLEQVYHY
ncbi:DNA helicase [Handroanthus impetiginosus]|uniref:DNA helicase n=1 Tax=Handroanthus impetiginosus TaxID=429701 RepID=A0A2G9G0E9_9LAMI|nr:DNA helicase [Handroanthus impetiginosus]